MLLYLNPSIQTDMLSMGLTVYFDDLGVSNWFLPVTTRCGPSRSQWDFSAGILEGEGFHASVQYGGHVRISQFFLHIGTQLWPWTHVNSFHD